MIEFSAEVGSLLKLIAEIAEKSGRILNKKLARINAEKNIASLRHYVSQVDQVWTLYQQDKVVSLRQIYYPLKVDFKTTVFTPKNADDLFTDRNCVVIQGTAGQGKSLFMRKLCMTELSRGKYIPLLVKLKD